MQFRQIVELRHELAAVMSADQIVGMLYGHKYAIRSVEFTTLKR